MKSFKKNNPLDNLNDTLKPSNVIRAEEQKSIVVPETKEKMDKERAEKKEKKYLRLDITDYQDYVSLMSQYVSKTSGKHVSMTQYILKLIEADKQTNREIYDKLAQIERMKNEII